MNKQMQASVPLYELIYQVLRDHIVGRRFAVGLVLGESTIARAFGTSRIPAAAALKRLKEEGLVRDFAGRGYLVGGKGRIEPVRLDLTEAGLELPAALKDGLALRNRGERIYPAVEHAVASCLAYGRFMLNESALAEHYGVSRAIAHEVLTKLERVGIITQDSNQRWYAGPLTEDLVRDHFEVRWTLEPLALTQAAPKIGRKELVEKRARVARIRDGRGKPELLEHVERDLHIEIVGRCNNSMVRQAVQRSQLILIATHSTFQRYQHTDEIRTMAAEHGAILDHLLGHRVPQAAAALEAHLRRSVEPNIALLRALRPAASDAWPPYLIPD